MPTGRDPLIELLLDFGALDLGSLSPEERRHWLSTVVLCLTKLMKGDGDDLHPPFQAAEWLELIIGRVAEDLPNDPGAVQEIRAYLRTLLLEHSAHERETDETG